MKFAFLAVFLLALQGTWVGPNGRTLTFTDDALTVKDKGVEMIWRYRVNERLIILDVPHFLSPHAMPIEQRGDQLWLNKKIYFRVDSRYAS